MHSCDKRNFLLRKKALNRQTADSGRTYVSPWYHLILEKSTLICTGRPLRGPIHNLCNGRTRQCLLAVMRWQRLDCSSKTGSVAAS